MTYTGRGGYPIGGGSCDEIEIGAPVVIHYEKADPANNLGGDPAAAIWNEIVFMILVALIFPPIVIWRFRSWREHGMPMHAWW